MSPQNEKTRLIAAGRLRKRIARCRARR